MLRVLAIVFSSCLSQLASAWSPYIHMVIMRLALRQMNPDAIVALDNVLEDPKWKAAYPRMSSLTQASIFADVILFDDHVKKNHFQPLPVPEWHYVDVSVPGPGEPAFSNSKLPVKDRVSAPGNPFDNNKNAAFILEKAVNDWDKACINLSQWYANMLLRYFIHAFMDTHQPMHASSAISQKHPNGDKGGLRIRFERGAIARNLHRLWDSAVNLFPKRKSWTPDVGPFSEKLENQLEQDADSLLRMTEGLSDDLIDSKRFQDMSFEEFKQYVQDESLLRQIIDETSQVGILAREGLEIKHGKQYLSPSQEYIETGQKIAAQQIVKSSWRLSQFLNLFGQKLSEDRTFVSRIANETDLN